MSSTPKSPLRRRVGLALGAGTLTLLAGGGIAYAAASSSEPVEIGWATVAAGDDTSRGAAGTGSDQTRSGDDCPDQGTDSRGGSASPDQAPGSSDPSQNGEL